MTSKSEISDWFDRGIQEGATHMIVVCDTYDWDDYPVYVKSRDAALRRVNNPGEMQKVMEVYNLDIPKEEQLNQSRSNNI